MELEIEKLVFGGDGLGRFEGIPVFVPRSAPGDRLRVRLVERRPDFGRAEIVEILTPGPGRRDAPCPHFARCGGCDLQHLDEVSQLRAKAQAVRETLERLGGVTLPQSIVVEAGKPWGYRQRTQLHVGEKERGMAVGYHERGSNKLVPVDRCPVLMPALEKVLPILPRAVRKDDRRRIDLTLGDDDSLTCAPLLEGLPHGPVTLTVGPFRYQFDARCFFQGHRPLLPRLVELAIGEWQGEQAIDLYGGVGLFGLPLAGRYARVTSVEGERIAARYARMNAKANQVDNVDVQAVSVETWIRQLEPDVDRVLVDPPRSGLSRPVRAVLRHRRPKRLTYVSCHAATLARDLKALDEAYVLESLALLDMFPQTGHMEVVAQLASREKKD